MIDPKSPKQSLNKAKDFNQKNEKIAFESSPTDADRSKNQVGDWHPDKAINDWHPDKEC